MASRYSSYISTFLVSLVLLALPFIWWVRMHVPQAWTQRLILPHLITEPDRHTPLFTDGQRLPARITHNLTITATSPIIVSELTTIEPNITVTIEPGTTLVFAELAGLVVSADAHLVAEGTVSQPILWRSNESHPKNKLWTGITFEPGSHGSLQHVISTDGSPAITCQPGSHVTISEARLTSPDLAFFTRSATCTLTHSRLISPRRGIVAMGDQSLFNFDTVTIQAGQKNIEYFPITP